MNPIFLIVILVICVIIVFILADIQSRKIPTTFPEEIETNEEEEGDEEDEILEEEEQEVEIGEDATGEKSEKLKS